MKKSIADSGRKFLYMNTNIQISDNREVIIENCKRIIEYNDIFVKVNTANMTIQIWGSEFVIDDCNNDAIVVKGKISSIELIEKKV